MRLFYLCALACLLLVAQPVSASIAEYIAYTSSSNQNLTTKEPSFAAVNSGARIVQENSQKATQVATSEKQTDRSSKFSTPQQTPFVIRIEQLTPIPFGIPTTIQIVYDEGSEAIGRFDFSLQHDPNLIEILSVSRGPALLQHAWSVLNVDTSTVDSCLIDCPRKITNFSSTAPEENNLSTAVPGTQFNQGDILAVLEIVVERDPLKDIPFTPIRWNWSGCNSNTILSSQADTIYQSRNVLDYIGSSHGPESESRNDITNKSDSLPGAGGMTADCDSTVHNPSVTPLRFIDFKNGGVQFICFCAPESDGDLNLNGLNYEPADLQVYVDFFTLGDTVFGTHVEGSTHASETNGDDKTLTVSDLTYLIRVVRGDAIRIPLLTHERDTVTITQRGDDLSTDIPLGALHLVFEGITPVELNHEPHGHTHGQEHPHGKEHNHDHDPEHARDHSHGKDDNHGHGHGPGGSHGHHSGDEGPHSSPMTLEVGIVDGNTHVLIYDFGNNLLHAGEILDDIEAPLLHADASDFNGSFVVVRFDFHTDVDANTETLKPNTFALHQNFPNPFNPTTTISFSLPKRSDVELTVYNMLGQNIRTLVSRSTPSGEHSIIWDGKNSSGSSVASGMYLYRLKIGDEISQTRKMVLLK